MPDTSGSNAQPTLYTIYPKERAVIRTYANHDHEGNQSRALRAIVRHFETCQFPLLGLVVDLGDADPEPQP